MTIEMLKNFLIQTSLDKIRYERFYRNRALELPCSETITNEYTKQLCEQGFVDINNDDITDVGNLMSSILFDSDSSNLLWFCQCVHIKNKSILALINSYIDQISKIKRGGINTYKRNGWEVHVLYVYQLINYNFSKNIVPIAYHWEFDVCPIFEYFHTLYNSLSNSAKFILNIGSFIHDIGVTIAINDHETKGIPLVEKYYLELGISESDLKENNIKMTQHEIIVILKILVGHHQLINQVAAEVSDKIINNKLQLIKKNLCSSGLKDFLNTEFIKIMYLLAAADMMAVDDSLLSNIKFKEITDASQYLQGIVMGKSYIRDKTKYGIQRFKCFLNDKLKTIRDEDLDHLIIGYGIQPELIWHFMYDIQVISYGVAAIKPLNDTVLATKFIAALYLIVTKYNKNYSDIAVCIKADFDADFIKEILQEHDVVSLSNIIQHDVVKMSDNDTIQLELSK